MAIVNEKRERIVLDDHSVAVCDQCDKRVSLDELHSLHMVDYPVGWILLRVTSDDVSLASSFCSWQCLAAYVSSRMSSEFVAA